MDPEEEKRIIDEILNKRRLSYSIEILDVQGDKYTVRNNFGSTIIYIKKGDNFIIEQDKD
ncbi:MAG: hypothetical protein ACFFD2_18490 [Promethearchaeota archaeon]